MAEVPNVYLDNPDPLSVLLERMALSAEVYVNGGFCGTWAVDTAGSRRIPFHLIGSGEAWLHFGSSEPVKLKAGGLVIFPSDAHHVIASSQTRPSKASVNKPISNDGETTQMVCGFFEFKNRLTFPLLDALPEVVQLSTNKGRRAKRLKSLVEMLLLELEDSEAGSYAVVNQIAYLVFIEVLRQQVQSGALASGLLVALFDSRVGKALSAMHQDSARNWTLESLADVATMSRSSFADQFNRIAGLSPMKYLSLWRMTEAHRLLAKTDMSTAQITDMSGYETEAAFRKAFKNTHGVTPGAVRKASVKSPN